MAGKTFIVMSDTHGDRGIIESIKNRYLGHVDAIFHNGDSELKSSDEIWQGIHVVAGNCDYDAGYPDKNIITIGPYTVAQTHGHLYHINFTWDKLDYFAQEAQADICLYGHLHRATAWKSSGIVFINPGSLVQPRGEINEKLYARVQLSDDLIKVEFFNRDHQIYPLLTKEFNR